MIRFRNREYHTKIGTIILVSYFVFLFFVLLLFSNFLVVSTKYSNNIILYFVLSILKDSVPLFTILGAIILLRIRKSDILDLLILATSATLGILYGLKYKANLFNLIVSAKDYMLIPFFLIFSTYYPFASLISQTNILFIYLSIIIIFFIEFFYTFYTYVNFNNNLYILWFYKYYQNPIWNYIRDNCLRAAGFFDTPIQNSIFFALTFSLFFFLFSYYRRRNIILTLLFLSLSFLSIVAIYFTHTRMGFMLIILTITFEAIYPLFKKKWLYFALVVVAIIFTFIYILFFSSDPSSKGRIIQYLNLFYKIRDSYILIFEGYGFGNVGPKTMNIAADSAIIESIYTFGFIGSVIYFYFYIRLIKKLEKVYVSNRIPSYLLPLIKFSINYLFLLIYTSFFHSMVGKTVLNIFFLLIAITISQIKNMEGNFYENSNFRNKRNTK